MPTEDAFPSGGDVTLTTTVMTIVMKIQTCVVSVTCPDIAVSYTVGPSEFPLSTNYCESVSVVIFQFPLSFCIYLISQSYMYM